MKLINAFINSLYNLKWISAQRNEKKLAWGYFFVLVFLTSLVISIPSVRLLPIALGTVKTDIENSVPDFNAEFKNGTLNVTKLAQPFITRVNEEKGTLLIVVNTMATSTLNVTEYTTSTEDSVMLISSKNFTFYDSTKINTESFSFTSIKDFSFDKNYVLQKLGKVVSGPFMFLIIFVLMVLIYVFTVIGKLLYLLIWALVVFLINLAFKKKWSYGQVYTVSLFAITVPILLQVLANLGGVQIGHFYTLIYWALMMGVIFSIKVEDPKVENPPLAPPSINQ